MSMNSEKDLIRRKVMRQSRTKKAGIALAAGVMAFLMVSSPLTVRAAEPWDMENGQYVDAAGTPITDHRSRLQTGCLCE